MYLIAIPVMAFLARLSGGGSFASKIPSWIPEAVFAGLIGLAAAICWGWWFAFTAIWSYFWMQAGHGTVYNMKGWASRDPNRIQTIEKIIRPLFLKLGGDIRTPLYSWLCMGFKGLMIGLPLFPFGLLLAVLWPASYAVKDTVWGEWLSGAATGVCMCLTIYYFAPL